ncbi:MAG: MFS transporter [Pseudolabrys sp.]|nr:MFS transporter [Pseudolabrys sp.]
MAEALPQVRTGFAARLSGLYAAIFILGGVTLPFLPVWLAAKGLDARTIGLVLAAPMLLRVFAVPLAARQADRRDALRGVIGVASLLTLAGYTAVGLSSGATAILIAFSFVALAYTPIMPLAESYALRGLAARGRAYGPVRLWGSAAFILGSFIAGFALDIIPARHLIWLIVAACALLVLAAFLLEPLPAPPAVHAPPPRKALLRDPAFIAVMAAASLLQASHALYYGFSALAWGAAGYDGTSIAALWALGVLAEIVLFALSARLPAFVSPVLLMLIGAAGGLIRWGAMALDPPGVMLPWLQLLHALSFGASHLGAMMLIARIVPHGQGATAQGYLAIAMGAAMAAATGLSGLLFAAYGTTAYAAMALAALAGGACAGVAHRALRVALR